MWPEMFQCAVTHEANSPRRRVGLRRSPVRLIHKEKVINTKVNRRKRFCKHNLSVGAASVRYISSSRTETHLSEPGQNGMARP